MARLDIVEDEKLWVPNPGGQEAFMNDYVHRYTAYSGGWGSGKTWAGARKSIDLHLLNAFDEEGDATFAKGLVIEPTYSLCRAIAIEELGRALDEANLKWRFVSDAQRFCFVLTDLGTRLKPSEIYVRSAELPQHITGFQVGWVWLDEAARFYSNDQDPTKDAILQADGRLREPKATFLQMNLTFTHEGDATPVFRRFEEESRPDHVIYHGSTEENPLLREWAAGQRKQLTDELAKQYLDGGAASFRGGAVYDNFDRTEGVNVDSTLTWDFSRPLQMGIDFNIDPGCHAELGQFFPQKQLVTTLREIYAERLNVKRLIPVLAKVFAEIGTYPGWRFPGKLELYGDASGGNSQAATGESCWEVLAAGLQQLGVPYTMVGVPSSNPHVADRVNSVNCAFRNMEGQIRYKIRPECTRLIADYRSMKWVGNELDKRDRHRSHGSDADGYRVYQLIPIRKHSVVSGRMAYG